jgi:hypothetical protein
MVLCLFPPLPVINYFPIVLELFASYGRMLWAETFTRIGYVDPGLSEVYVIYSGSYCSPAYTWD